MAVKSIMTTRVVTVGMDDSLAEVREIFSNTTFHHLLVIENDRLFGIISDRDLFKALSPRVGTISETERDAATLNRKVHQIMSRNPISIHQDEGVYKAIEIFEKNSISCIPVVDEDDKPVGILSWRDIFKAIMRKNRGKS